MKPLDLMAFGLAGTVLLSSTAQAQAGAPIFAETSCDLLGTQPFDTARFRCGTIDVPRLTDNPNAGVYKLRVVIAKATEQAPRPDAVVPLAGGPGFPAIPPDLSIIPKDALARTAAYDVVMIDPRGTLGSEPTVCRDVNIFTSTFLAPAYSAGELLTAVHDAMGGCLAEASAQGIDIGEFGTAINAEDVERVRQALGYGPWNLAGTSYGAVTALEIASHYPASVRSMVLDSPALGVHERLSIGQRWERAFTELLAECERDVSCARDYPDVGTEWNATLERLESQPLAIPMPADYGAPNGIALLDRGDLEMLLYFMSYSRASAEAAPAFVRAVMDGRTAPIAEALLKVQVDGALSVFTLAATLCRDGSAAREAAITAPGASAYGFQLITIPPDKCGQWASSHGAPALPADAPPTLVLTGALDPATPPANAQMITEVLGSAAQLVEFPSVGHGVLQLPCAGMLVDAFIAEPSAALDLTCVQETSPLSFLAPTEVPE